MDYYRDKVVFITGAASGIGLELARQLVGLGARVVLTDRDGEACRAAAESLGQASEAVTLDVTRADDFEKALDAAWQRFGRVDIVVNNAGFGTGGEIADIDSGIWERIVAVNLMGVAHGCRLAFPRMAAQGGGQIVNIASMFGLLPGPLFAPYVATKHAVVGLSRSLRLEGKASHVKVTAVCPGFIETPLFDNAETAPGVDRDRGRESIPFRFLPVEKAAATIIRGVARNPERLVFPFEVRLLCWLDRMAPWLTNWLFLQSLKNTRNALAAS
jgi:NAD(P)-dependent dehydrogenase (short-subunit alcohol dehydrogenase family)